MSSWATLPNDHYPSPLSPPSSLSILYIYIYIYIHEGETDKEDQKQEKENESPSGALLVATDASLVFGNLCFNTQAVG